MRWEVQLELWCHVFNQPAVDFWTATPFEFWALYEKILRQHRAKAPMSRSKLKALMEKFPDGDDIRRTGRKT